MLRISIDNCNFRVNKLTIWQLLLFISCLGGNLRQIEAAPDRTTGFPSAASVLYLNDERPRLAFHLSVCP
jgi:hypothetical protein